MKRMGLIVSVLLSAVLVVLLQNSGVINRFSPQASPTVSQLDVALTSMLTSYTRWQTVSGEAEFLWYGDDGKTQSYTNKFALALPNQVYVDVIDNTGAGVDGMWISNHQNIYAVNKKDKTYQQSTFPQNKLDTADLPTSLSQLNPDDGVMTHPLQRMMGVPVMEYLFPIWFPQGHKGDTYTITEEVNLLGRKVWVIKLDTIYKDDVTAWVDQETGIILKYNQIMAGKKFLEMTFTSFQVNGQISSAIFSPPPGYSQTSPQIPVQEISTVAPIPPTALAQPLAGPQKKDILLVKKSGQEYYFVSDLSASALTPLETPVDIDRITIAMSPDGRLAAYIPDTNDALYLLDIATHKITNLTPSTEIQPVFGPVWSPNSQQIVFSCWVQGTRGVGLCSMDVTGAETIKVLVKSDILDVSAVPDGAIAPSWSADGRKIVFQSSRSPLSLAEGVKTEVSVDLWMFDVATQQAKRIFVGGTAGISMIMQPVFLPDENAVLFSGRKDTYNTIFKYDLDTQEIQDITASGHRFDLTDILLSPDGKTFLTYIPVLDDGSQGYVPVLYSVDGGLIKQLDALKNMQVISWGEQ